MRTLAWPETGWGLFDDLQGLQEEMNRAFNSRGGRFSRRFPPVNAWVNDEKVVAEFELPGVDIEKVDVSIKGETLAISGERTPPEVKQDDSYHRQERVFGSFSRTLHLPFRVNHETAEANYEKGVLRITIARSEEDKRKRISIKSE